MLWLWPSYIINARFVPAAAAAVEAVSLTTTTATTVSSAMTQNATTYCRIIEATATKWHSRVVFLS